MPFGLDFLSAIPLRTRPARGPRSTGAGRGAGRHVGADQRAPGERGPATDPSPSARIVTLRGVVRPRSDAHLLVRIASERGLLRDARVLDLFTGSGVLGIAAALHDARHVTTTDVSRRAVLTVAFNAWRNGVRVRALRGDLLAPVAGERFDLILANADGRMLVGRLCDAAAAHLSPRGRLLIAQSSPTGEHETLDRLAAAGLRARVVHRAHDEQLLVIEAASAAARGTGAGPARVTPYRDGPFLLRGDFELTDQDGNPIETTRSTVALCRCGQSQIRPFCDGSHKLVGFRCDSAAEERPEPG